MKAADPIALRAGRTSDTSLRPHARAPSEVLKPEDVSRLENESRSTEREFVFATESHGKNVMDLMLLRTYTKKLLDNAGW